MKLFLYFICQILLACTLIKNLHAESFSLTGNWNYQDTNAAVDQFSENYSVNIGKNFDLTEAMSLGTSLRFNRSKDEALTRENLSPSVNYLLSNDLFVFNLSGAANEEFNSKNAENSSRSFSANWNSLWEKEKWVPYVGLNYNRSWLKDDQNPHLVDTNTTSTGLTTDWEFLLSKLFYSFNFNESNNSVSGSIGKSSNHLARFETSRSFWNDKVSVSFSQQYNTSLNENILPVSGGVALLKVAVSGFSDEVNPPAGNYSLTTNSDLTDGDTTDNAVTTVNDANLLHIGFRANSQTLHTLYLYTDATLPLATYSAFNWDLYSSNANATWVLETSGLTATYDTTNNRFEIDISGYPREYLGVVATSDAGATLVTFSEVEVYQQISASGSSTLVKNRFTNHSSDINLNYRITPDLQLTSNFSYEQNINSSGPDLNSTRVNTGVNWYPAEDVTVRLNGDFTARSREGSMEDQSRSYGVSVAFPPLPTVSTVLGATLSQSYESTRKISEGYNYNFQAVASLYEDLDARFNGSYRQNYDKVDDSRSNSTSLQTTLTARLIPGLVADLSSNYNKASGQAATIDSTLSMHWRLSEMLSVTGNITQAWASSDTSSMSLGFDLALTRKMQLSMTHSRAISPDPSHATTLNWRWTISQYISMLTSGSYQNGHGSESWSVTSRLNARFSVM